MKAHSCPICGGNGLVMAGFYNQCGGSWTGSNTGFEMCRSCKGTGVVWEPEGLPPLTTQIFGPVQVDVIDYVPCTFPPIGADGRPYIGDVICKKHAPTVTCAGGVL